MQNFSANQVWFSFAVVVVVLSAVLSLADKILSIRKKAKEPEDKQNDELAQIKKRLDKLEYKQKDLESHSDKIDSGIYVLMLGSLALLDHGLDGNNIEAMAQAKKKLQEHLAKNNT